MHPSMTRHSFARQCSEDCQAEDWRSHHKAQCKWLRGKKADLDKIQEVQDYNKLDDYTAWFSSTKHETASPADPQHRKEAKRAVEVKSLSYKGLVVKEYVAPKLSTDMKILNEVALDLLRCYPVMVMPNRPNPISTRRAKALIPRTVKTLKDYLVSHPEYDSESGYRDSHLDPRSEFQETFHPYFTELPEFKAVLETDEEARAISATYFELTKKTCRKENMNKDGIEEELEEFVKGFLEIAFQPNPCLMRGIQIQVHAHIKESLKAYLSAHPQYNNHRGVDLLWQNDTLGILSNMAYDGFKKQLREEYSARGDGIWDDAC